MKRRLIFSLLILFLIFGTFAYVFTQKQTTSYSLVDAEEYNQLNVQEFTVQIFNSVDYYGQEEVLTLERNNDLEIKTTEAITYRANFQEGIENLYEHNGVIRFAQDFSTKLHAVNSNDGYRYNMGQQNARIDSTTNALYIYPFVKDSEICTHNDIALFAYQKNRKVSPAEWSEKSKREFIDLFCEEYEARKNIPNLPDGKYYLEFLVFDENDTLVAKGISDKNFKIVTIE